MKYLVLLGFLLVGTNAFTAYKYRFGDIIGPAGIVRADGTNVQFTPDQADNIASAGPSGVVTKDGRNIQFSEHGDSFGRTKRSSAGSVTHKGIIGHAGILRTDGSSDLFSHDEAHNILLIGPAGIVTKDGQNMQLTEDLRIVGRSKRSAGFVNAEGSISHAGIHRADGSTDLFSHDQAHNILLIGPGGIVTRDGRNLQLTADLRIAGRSKRSAGFLTPKGSLSHAGIHRADGSTDLFTNEEAHNILLIGPGGIVMKDGRNLQLTEDLRIVGRSKRHVFGESGMILDDGTQVQFKEGGVTILLEGPSGILLSDGTQVQKKQ